MPDYSGLLKETAPNIDPAKKPGAGLFADAGIYSPSEKLQMQLQQQQAQQAQFLLQQQMMAQQQSMQLANANAKSGAPTGFNFAPFLAMGGGANLNTADKLATQARGSGQPTQVPQIDSSSADAAGIDPGSILSRALQQYPTDKATALRVAGKQIAGLGDQRGSSYLQNIGANLLSSAQEADKEQASIEATKASTANTQEETLDKKGKRGNPGTPFNIRDNQGNEVPMAPTYNPDGSFKGWEKIAPGGPNKQVTEDTTPLTKTQFGAQVEKFQSLVTSSRDAIDGISDISKSLKDGAAIGWTGKVVSLIDDAAGALSQLAPNSTLTAGAQAELTKRSPTFAGWAAKTRVQQSQIIDLVSALAKTNNNNSGQISENDIKRASTTLGGNIGSPASLAAVLDSVVKRTLRHVDNHYASMLPESQKATKGQYDSFLQHYTPGADGPDNSDQSDTSALDDNAPAQYAQPQTQEDYDKIKGGQLYIDTDGKLKKKKAK